MNIIVFYFKNFFFKEKILKMKNEKYVTLLY